MTSYPQQYTGGQPPVVVTTQPVATSVILFRDVPVPMKCMHCQADIMTSTQTEIGTMNWIVCGIILLVGLFCPLVCLGCCFIPFCISSLKDVVHTCPNCNQIVGRHNKMG